MGRRLTRDDTSQEDRESDAVMQNTMVKLLGSVWRSLLILSIMKLNKDSSMRQAKRGKMDGSNEIVGIVSGWESEGSSEESGRSAREGSSDESGKSIRIVIPHRQGTKISCKRAVQIQEEIQSDDEELVKVVRLVRTRRGRSPATSMEMGVRKFSGVLTSRRRSTWGSSDSSDQEGSMTSRDITSSDCSDQEGIKTSRRISNRSIMNAEGGNTVEQVRKARRANETRRFIKLPDIRNTQEVVGGSHDSECGNSDPRQIQSATKSVKLVNHSGSVVTSNRIGGGEERELAAVQEWRVPSYWSIVEIVQSAELMKRGTKNEVQYGIQYAEGSIRKHTMDNRDNLQFVGVTSVLNLEQAITFEDSWKQITVSKKEAESIHPVVCPESEHVGVVNTAVGSWVRSDNTRRAVEYRELNEVVSVEGVDHLQEEGLGQPHGKLNEEELNGVELNEVVREEVVDHLPMGGLGQPHGELNGVVREEVVDHLPMGGLGQPHGELSGVVREKVVDHLPMGGLGQPQG